MFTGIVLAVGIVKEASRAGEGRRLRVRLRTVAAGARAGDSIAVAGTCLTLAEEPADGVGTFDLVRETLERTTLGAAASGTPVNLEPALRVGDRMGGHFVQGHVDGVGTVRSLRESPGATLLTVGCPADVAANLIEKGSVAVDGVALTVVAVDRESFSVALVPHTLAVTTLGSLRTGSRVNLEADYFGKWVRRILSEGPVRTC